MLRIESEKKFFFFLFFVFLVATGFEPRTPACESNVLTTAPANYVFKTESSFWPAKRFLPSEDFVNPKYILIIVAQPIFDLKSIDFTPK